MSGKIYVVNVGTNASHLFCSPIFEDGTFEFIPIPEAVSYTHLTLPTILLV